jgi:hypothetical protein
MTDFSSLTYDCLFSYLHSTVVRGVPAGRRTNEHVVFVIMLIHHTLFPYLYSKQTDSPRPPTFSLLEPRLKSYCFTPPPAQPTCDCLSPPSHSAQFDNGRIQIGAQAVQSKGCTCRRSWRRLFGHQRWPRRDRPSYSLVEACL